MRRRDFLAVASGTALATALKADLSFAQADPGDRAAVVIGINHAGNLPVLNAAVSGADQMAEWLTAQRFDVKELVDRTGPVTAHDVKAAVSEFVNRGTLTQLVIYFAGHGFISGYSEFWLLSGAPDDVDEAIVLTESIDQARQTGIQNVVFVSDACRSTADSLGTARVRGSVIFPNGRPHPNVSTDVDRLLATQVGDPAYEVAVTESTRAFRGLYTTSFLSAFQTPTADMVLAVDGVDVVPSRRLKGFLLKDVPKRAQASSITLRQLPSSIIESDEPTYIGRIAGPAPSLAPVVVASAPPASPAPPPASLGGAPTINDVAAHSLHRALRRARPVRAQAQIEMMARRSGFSQSQVRARVAPSAFEFDTRMGFTVTGATVRAVRTTSGVEASLLRSGDGTGPALVRLGPERPNASVALAFGDGSGTILAAIRDFVAHVAVEASGVVNVSYVPARSSARWAEYQRNQDRLNELRATVAAAVKFGAFEAPDADFGEQIRVLKGVDPTLGIYAAYAFNEAGKREQVSAVYAAMRGDLETVLFDVALLADRIASEQQSPNELVPLCPMLSQGWNLLRVKAVAVHPALAAARDALRPALWTTFGSTGMDLLMRADLWR